MSSNMLSNENQDRKVGPQAAPGAPVAAKPGNGSG